MGKQTENFSRAQTSGCLVFVPAFMCFWRVKQSGNTNQRCEMNLISRVFVYSQLVVAVVAAAAAAAAAVVVVAVPA